MFIEWDIFGDEFRQFEWDLHVLIEGTVAAGQKSLSDQLDAELAKFAEYRALPNADQEHLTAEYVDLLEMNNEQDVFLRNAALVSLTILLHVTLKRMLRQENFKPRKEGRYPGNQFARLWSEFKQRFGIEFAPEEIDFVEPMVMARNQIVHEGADAALIQPGGSLDTSFADSYPQYVRHAGSIMASVEVTQELLDMNIEKSIALVRSCAERLKAVELESRRFAKEDNQASREGNEKQQSDDLK